MLALDVAREMVAVREALHRRIMWRISLQGSEKNKHQLLCGYAQSSGSD
jgi:hypothetical protein